MLAYSPTVYMNPINFDLRKTHWMVWKGSHNMQTEAKYKNYFILLHFIRKITKAELENDCAMPHRDLWIFLDKQIRMHTGFRFAFVFFLAYSDWTFLHSFPWRFLQVIFFYIRFHIFIVLLLGILFLWVFEEICLCDNVLQWIGHTEPISPFCVFILFCFFFSFQN